MKRLTMCFLAIVILIGCNSSGDDSSSNTPPLIHRVDIVNMDDGPEWAQFAFRVGDPINFRVYASDPDLDITAMYISQYLVPNYDTSYYPVSENYMPPQVAVDMVYFMEQNYYIPGPDGEWVICFLIVDAKGMESNEYCVRIDIDKPIGNE